MNEIVYVKAIVQGENASGQKLVKLVAQNTDGMRPFWTVKKDLICREDVFPETQKVAEKTVCFLQKVFNTKK